MEPRNGAVASPRHPDVGGVWEGTRPRAFPRAVAYGCAFLSGLLYWLAFPGVDAWPVSFVAWVPLILAVRGQPTRRTTRLGALAGLTMNVCGFFWLQTMLRTFSGFSAPICFFFVLVVCAYQAGRIALLGWLFGRATSRGWPAVPVFAAAFVASELTFPLLFPWYYAATVHGQPVLTQTADLGGPILVGLILVGANMAVAELIAARLERRIIAWRTVATGALGLSAAVLYGFIRVREVDAATHAAPESTVGLVQANMGLIEKRTQFAEGVSRHLEQSHEARAKGADFLVWSETSAMRAVHDDTYEDELRPLSSRIGLPTLFGSVIIREVADDRRYILFNSAITSDATGAIASRYDKEYLLTFGEYLPFGETFPILYRWSPNSGHFSAGTSLDPLILDVHGVKHPVTPLICYEDILPSFTNTAVRHADPELLVNLTNDAWFGDTFEPWEHLALSALRAVEHHRYLVRGTNSGVSAVIDPVGRVVAQSGTFRRDTITAPIHWMRSRTVYETLGDWPWALVTCAAFLGAFRRRRASDRPAA